MTAATPPPSGTLAQVGRGAQFGLGLGLLSGAVYLSYFAVQSAHHPRSCESVGASECALLRASDHDLLRLEVMASIAFLLLAAVFLRSLWRGEVRRRGDHYKLQTPDSKAL